MKKSGDNPSQSPDPVKLADDAVLALSSLARGSKISPELLEEGIKLCEYLIYLFQELKMPEGEREQWTFYAVRDDRKALQESRIDIGEALRKTEEVKKWIGDLITNPSSHTQDEIEGIKEHLMTITMPIWQKRTLEFRERKMKRSLIVHG
jgi:hypothetical protein